MNKEGKLSSKHTHTHTHTHQNFIVNEDELVGTVTLGVDHKPICFPGSATITALGKVSKPVVKRSYMLGSAAHNNLPSGIVVDHSYVTPKAGQVALILINTTDRNVWICHLEQPLAAADIYEVELYPWQYHLMLNTERKSIKIGFQLVVPPEVEGSLQTNQIVVELRPKPFEE